MNSELSEKLSVFCTGLLGVATCTGLVTGGLALTAAGLSLPAVVRQIRADAGGRDLADRTKKAIEANWRAWVHADRELDPGEVEGAFVALGEVLYRLEPDVDAVRRHGDDHTAIADEVLSAAAVAAEGRFLDAGYLSDGRPNLNRDVARTNRLVLRSVIIGTLDAMAGPADYRAALDGWMRDCIRDIAATAERTEGKVDRALVLLEELAETSEAAQKAEAAGAHEAVVALARRISAEIDDFEQAMRQLDWAVGEVLKAQDEAARGSNLGEVVDGVLARLAVLTADGAFDDASALADQEIERWERNETERRKSALAAGLRLLNAGIRQDLLRLDAEAAAIKIVRRIDVQVSEPTFRLRFLHYVWNEWFVRGRDQGLNLDLEVAIQLAQIAERRISDPDSRGEVLNCLGVSLERLGKREQGTERLEQAVVAHEAALEIRTRERAPYDWAATRNNLGAALLALAERASGTDLLKQAVAAFRAALEVRTRERVPFDWATSQNNLGSALCLFGQREVGTASLEEAVVAFRDALEIRTRDRGPGNWATTQSNLGSALFILGERERSAEILGEAVAAYRAALEVCARDRVPLHWAGIQHNLGCALKVMGEIELRAEWVEQAVIALRAALEERSRERVPLDWAATQHSLGGALGVQGIQTPGEAGEALLSEAVAACRVALEVLTEVEHPVGWANAQEDFGLTHEAVADRREGDERREALGEALAALDAALRVYHPEHTGYAFERCTEVHARVAAKLAEAP